MEPKISEKNIMYVNTECSPSHLFDNISISDKSIMYIHNSEAQPRIILIDRKLFDDYDEIENVSKYITKLNSSETNEMITFKCLDISDTECIAVGLYGGFKLWSIDGNRLLFNIPCKIRTGDKPYAFTSIAGYKVNSSSKNYDSIICGDNYGQVFLVTGSGSTWRAKIIYSYDGVAATSIIASNEYIAVGFENSEVHFIKLNNETGETLHKFTGDFNLPVSSMGRVYTSLRTYVVACFINGECKIFNFSNNNFELVFSVNAHIRIINSVITYKNYFITAGDDCYVNVFNIDDKENVNLVSSHLVSDKMPIGLSLMKSKTGNDLLISCFDCTYIGYIRDIF